MAHYFDENELADLLSRNDWYVSLFPRYGKLSEIPEAVEEFYAFFERKLAEGGIIIGSKGPNWDEERKPIDTIVIHHTHRPSGITRERLSAMHLIRLYAANYASPAPSDYHIMGDPIFSNHFYRGKQVFYAYHWIIRMDGTAERLLADDQIGWHAGNWGVNCRSVGIVLDNDFEHKTPSDAVIAGAARLIREHYPHVAHEQILGHREVNPKTTCPSDEFLGGWKQKLLSQI